MRRLCLLIGLLCFLTTCVPKWAAYPQDVPDFKTCNNFKTTQMLKIPEFERSYIIVLNCQTTDRERVSIAMTIFLEEWRKIFPGAFYEASTTLNDIIVEFNNHTKTQSGYTVRGEYVKDANLTGLAYTKSMAWVKTDPGDRICNTSFTHELVHMVLWTASDQNGDPDHEGKKYVGWSYKHTMLIDIVNQRLCTLGI